MARKQQSRKRRVKKNIQNGIAHIRSTFNNSIVTITDEHEMQYHGQVQER